MTSHNPFGGSSIESLKLLQQFKKLDAKLDSGNLTDAERKRYQELSEKLANLISPTAKNKRPKRKSIRVDVNRQIKLQSGKELSRYYMKNISGGGLYVETNSPLKIGTKVQLEVVIDEEEKKLKLSGIVAWVNPNRIGDMPAGMGIQFENLSREDEIYIRKMVRLGLEQAILPKAGS